jgi:hypothetical protein
MKIGDIIYARYPLIVGSDKPGIIIEKQPMYKIGYRYQVMFPIIGTRWIEFGHNLIKLEDAWSKECE